MSMVFTLISLLNIGLSLAQTPTISNGEVLKRRFGTDAYGSAQNSLKRDLKIAIFDNGFAGFKSGSSLLPASAQLIEGPKNPQKADDFHGLGMAMILWEVMGKPDTGVKFYLVNADGYTNFKAGVQFAIQNQVDIVLYSQVWTFGGNFDGTGFIDAQVSQAIRAGITWINAAGNYGSKVSEGSVSEQLTTPRYFTVLKKGAPVTLTLSWNDFDDSSAAWSDQDLDLFVVDEAGKLVGSSEKKQLGHIPGPGDKNVSAYARETLTLNGLPEGKYRIEIKNISNNFTADSRFRVLLESNESVVFNSATLDREVFPPADHPEVITVGEDSPVSSRAVLGQSSSKPDFVLPKAIVDFSDKTHARGSSVAAAIFAGIYAKLKQARPDFNRTLVLTRVENENTDFAIDPDFKRVNAYEVPADLQKWITPECEVGFSYAHQTWVLQVPFQPVEFFPELRKPQGLEIRRSSGGLSPKLWKTPSPDELKRL